MSILGDLNLSIHWLIFLWVSLVLQYAMLCFFILFCLEFFFITSAIKYYIEYIPKVKSESIMFCLYIRLKVWLRMKMLIAKNKGTRRLSICAWAHLSFCLLLRCFSFFLVFSIVQFQLLSMWCWKLNCSKRYAIILWHICVM